MAPELGAFGLHSEGPSGSPRYQTLRCTYDGAVAGYNTFHVSARAMTPDGRLWFASDLSLQMIDPSTIDGLENQLPPPVHVTRIVGDEKPLVSLVHAVLPRFTHSIEIDDAALELGVPKRFAFSIYSFVAPIKIGRMLDRGVKRFI